MSESECIHVTLKMHTEPFLTSLKDFANSCRPDRDTQFAEFAKLLWDKLIEANGYDYIDVNKWDDDGIDPVNYRLVIAQATYDLIQSLTNPNSNTVDQTPDVQ